MKFGRQYTIFMHNEAQHLLPDCPYVEFKAFKKLLRQCPHEAGPRISFRQQGASIADCEGNEECYSRRSENSTVACPIEFDHNSSISLATSAVQDRARIMGPDEDMEPNEDSENNAVAAGTDNEPTSSTCSVCDAEFFSNLDKAVSAVVGCFNAKARELLRLHNASRLRKALLRLTTKARGDRGSMLQLGNMLVNYGCMNAIAIRKILKKYDKCRSSGNGQAFKTRLQVKRLELLQSPLLIELGALAVNIMDSHMFRPLRNPQPQGISSPCSFDDKNQAITCVLQDGIKIEFDLTCSICLEVVFDPVTLGCGHIFCNSCACAAASVPVFHGATSARRSTKCALCRQTGVYLHATSMRELWILIKNRCTSYYAERLVVERRQRVREAKLYWEGQTQRFCQR